MKCKLRNCQTIRVFEPVGKVFFLHLNRFSHINGVIRKELATQKIPRVFMGYELIGIVFHIGKNVQTGHYIYYQRVGAKRWAEMNDNQVFEFELSAPDE